jgi:signal transduction histidine kinase
MENTYTGTLSIDKNGSVKTIKKDEKNHGYGLKNVLEIIERYGGEKDINAEEKRFRVDVTFHIKKPAKK